MKKIFDWGSFIMIGCFGADCFMQNEKGDF